MTRDDIEQKVKNVLATKLSHDVATILPESRLAEDLGVDSFGAVELMFEIEEAFGLKIADSDIQNVRTVKDVVDYVELWSGKPPATAGA